MNYEDDIDTYFARLKFDKLKLYPSRIFTCSSDFILCEIISINEREETTVLRWRRGKVWDQPQVYPCDQITEVLKTAWYHGEGDLHDKLMAKSKRLRISYGAGSLNADNDF